MASHAGLTLYRLGYHMFLHIDGVACSGHIQKFLTGWETPCSLYNVVITLLICQGLLFNHSFWYPVTL
ncbi:Arsenite methyltransferase [Fusarium oxysporum f. sp. albedinis]|nr:Arsenite methyltransferase [Fusarium oxysporum f. sp. albedinis]